MRNKILVSASLLLLTLSFFANSSNSVALAQSTPTIVVGSYAPHSIGETVPIKVYVVWASNVTGYQFQLRFNATLLQCLSASMGNWFPGPPNSNSMVTIDNSQGIVSIQAYLQGSATPLSVSGAQLGTLLSASFNAAYGTPWGPQPQESCTLAITGDALYGIGNQTIQHAVQNGTYTAPYAPPQLNLTLNTNDLTMKFGDGSYYFEDFININGTLTGNGYPITDALVALEIQDPSGQPIVARTFQTSNTSVSCPLNITALTPCDSGGDPQNSFGMESFVHFNVAVENVGSNDLAGLMLVNMYDSSNASLGVAYFGVYVPAGGSTNVILGLPLNYDSNYLALTPPASGIATVYASVWTDFAANGGTPLSLESQATFTITGTAQGKGTSMNPASQGTYQTGLRVHFRHNTYSSTIQPNYTISVGAEYMGNKATVSNQIQITIAGDMNRDGKVDLIDLVILAQAYLSKTGGPRWDPRADANRDGAVDLLDLVILAQNYLKGTA